MYGGYVKLKSLVLSGVLLMDVSKVPILFYLTCKMSVYVSSSEKICSVKRHLYRHIANLQKEECVMSGGTSTNNDKVFIMYKEVYT